MLDRCVGGIERPVRRADSWLQHRRAAIAVLFALLAGGLYSLALVGPEGLDPTRTRWLLNLDDPAQMYLGFAFLHADPAWHFPLTYTDRIGYPLGAAVAYLDSIPIAAVVAKALSPFLPETFQYLGPWVALSFVLHAYFALRLCEAIAPDSPSSALLGASILLLAPAAAARVNVHFALASHWLILAALWLYFRPHRGPVARQALVMLWLCLAASGVHPYLLLLCVVIVGASYWRMVRERRASRRQAVVWAAITTAATAGSLFVLGYFMGGDLGSYVGGGSKDFGFNLLSPINPMQYGSILLPSLPVAALGQYEGFNYLGVGVLALLAMHARKLAALRAQLRSPALRPIFVCAIALTIASLSLKLSIGPYHLTNFSLGHPLMDMIDVFRAVGRLFWPVGYLLMLLTIWGACRLRSRGAAFLLLAAALALQIADTAGVRRVVRSLAQLHDPSPLPAPQWHDLGRLHRKLIILPALQCDRAKAPGKGDGFSFFGALAVEQGMVTNSYLATRYDAAGMPTWCEAMPRQVAAGELEPDAAYVVSKEFYANSTLDRSPSHSCIKVDGFILCRSKAAPTP